MSYRPRLARRAAMRDAILAALRDGPLTTKEVATALGWVVLDLGRTDAYCRACQARHPDPVRRPVEAADIAAVLLSMERHNEVIRRRSHRAAPGRWERGPAAPPIVDAADLEALLDEASP